MKSYSLVFMIFIVFLVVAAILTVQVIADISKQTSFYSQIDKGGDTLSDYSWPMFRHNLNRTGYTDSPAPINNQTIWTFQTGGAVYSSPAVVDGKVYVGSDDGCLYCLNVTTTTPEGVLIWKYKTGGPVKSSPTVIDDQVFFGSDDGYLYCLNSTTGQLIWKFQTDGNIRSSPAIVGEKVIFGSNDRYVYAIDRFYLVNGTPYLIWKYGPLGESVEYSSPAVVNKYVLIGTQRWLYCLNANSTNPNGELIWVRELSQAHPYGSYVHSPAVKEGKVFVSYGLYHWGHSGVACIDISSGNIIWEVDLGAWRYVSSVAVAYNKIFLGHELYIYCFNQTNGELLWSVHEESNEVISSPAVSGGLVFVGRGDGVYCLNESTGEIVWKFNADARSSSPAIVNGRLYVGAKDGRIIAFGNATHLSISVNPQDISLGGSTLISGKLYDAFYGHGLPSRIIKLEFSPDRGETWIPIGSTVTTSDGSYTYIWTPPTAGRYITVRAIFMGDESYNGATSPGCFVHVNKVPSILTISANPSTITYGESTNITGFLKNPEGIGLPNQTICLEYSADGSTYYQIATVTTLPNGNYSYKWSPPAGTYILRANFTGNVNYTESSSTTSLVVNKASTTITISASPSNIACGNITTINGILRDQHGKPLSGQTVMLQYSINDGATWNMIASVTTFPDGSYSYPWAPQEVGSYLIQIEYMGNTNYDPSSNKTSINVTKGSSSITTIPSATTITYGQNVTISCLVNPPVSDGIITFQWSIDTADWHIICTGTPSNGTFSITWKPPYIGTFHIRALWSGNINYNGSMSISRTITVTKASSSINLSLSSTTTLYGQTLSLSAEIVPITDGTVTFEYSLDGSTWITIKSGLTSTGTYSGTWDPPDVGIFYVRARWDGNANYNGAISTTAVVTVNKANSSLDIRCPVSITYGSNVTISGALTPVISEALISLEYSVDNGQSWNQLTTLMTNTNGEFTYIWVQPPAGVYQLRVLWSGNTQYQGTVSLPVHLTINKAPSSITCQISSTSTIINSGVTISGKLNPAISNVTITIYYRLKGMPTYNILATTQTDRQGKYQYLWTPKSAGTYEITIAWTGTNNYDGAQSGILLLNVLNPEQVPYEDLQSQLSQARMLQYIFMGTTIVFVISTVFFALRKKSQK